MKFKMLIYVEIFFAVRSKRKTEVQVKHESENQNVIFYSTSARV